MNIGIGFRAVSDTSHLEACLAERLFGKTIDAEMFRKEMVISDGLLTTDQCGVIEKHIYRRSLEQGSVPVDGVFDALHCLLDAGHGLTLIATHSSDCLDRIVEWLEARGFEIPIIAIERGASFSHIAHVFDVYVDTNLKQIRDIGEVIPRKFLLGSIDGKELSEDVVVCSKWCEVKDSICDLPIYDFKPRYQFEPIN